MSHIYLQQNKPIAKAFFKKQNRIAQVSVLNNLMIIKNKLLSNLKI